jgi:hypothetical protein
MASLPHLFCLFRVPKAVATAKNIAKLEHQLRKTAEERAFYQEKAIYFHGLLDLGNGHQQGQEGDGRETRITSLHTPATGPHAS